MFPSLLFGRGQKLKGTVVLMQKNVLDINALTAVQSPGGIIGGAFGAIGSITGSILDTATAFLGRSVALKLISRTNADASGKGKVSNPAFLEGLVTSIPTLGDKQCAFSVYFEWNSNMGIPGAFYIDNFMQGEFFLVSLTIEDVPNHGTINFVCNSWIYNYTKYKTGRIFFANKTYLPSETPAPLVFYRQEELKTLRGDGTRERKEWERIYDYDVYNDLGAPDKKTTLARPVLGGSSTLPYPRRGRTGRKPTRKDPKSESRSDIVYLPRDESFGHVKSSDFLVYILKSASQNIIPQLRSVVTLQLNNPEFNTFEDVRSLYDGGIKLPTDILSKISPIPLFKELFRSDGESALKFPPPKVVQVDHSAWMTDEEFAREMIAGVNPHIIKKLQNFPPKSSLDSQLYGDNTSTITKEQLEPNMGGVSVQGAIQTNRLYILDHHDPLFPYLRKINATNTKAYATRTILFLQDDGTLKPLAIELSTPHPEGDSFGPVSKVYLPATEGVEASIWLLAKAFVIVNDSCYHQLVSHWLNTHAVVEPFIIATNRHLSVVHPIHKLLLPHYRDTMNINALARNVLVNAEGIIESTFLWGNYAMEMSAVVYKDWVFTDQGLPNDLIKRGVAVKDPSAPYGLRLLIEDYPYASDGLEIWAAIKSWVEEYVNFYYKSDGTIAKDSELQAFWKEVVEVGHGDLKNATWWFKMKTRAELIEACTILIWIASALHAAVNFGQYPYGGYILNRPTKSRRFMPEPVIISRGANSTPSMENLPSPLVVEILTRLKDSSDLARCRAVSTTLNQASNEVRSLTLHCSMSRYLKSRSPETKHLVTPFKTVLKNLVHRSRDFESVSIGVDRSLGGISFDDVEDESDDLHLTEFNFILDWLPCLSRSIKSLSVSDFWVQSCWRRSKALSLISSTCYGLVQLVIRNAWLAVDGLCLMPTLTNLTLEFVRLDDEDLNMINTCFPNLTQLNLIGVGGFKEPSINLSRLQICQWSVSNAPLSLTICAPSLVDFHLKCIKPKLIFLDAPSLSNFNLSLENTDELVLKNCGNIQCLQLEVECLSLGFILSMFRRYHCIVVERLNLDFVRRTQIVIGVEVDQVEFGFDILLNYFPNIRYLSLGSGAWHAMESSFRSGSFENATGMKTLKELIAHIVVLEIEFTLAFIFSILDKCTQLGDISMLIHSDVDPCVAGNLISTCRSKFPGVRWRWGIWKEGIKDTWVSDGI